MPARLSAAGAAFVNGTAAHGEDFDDTFEGGPVHAGAVIVPAVLAACERYGRDGTAALLGIAVGVEIMCRLGLVAPKVVHKAGFHPTAVFGAMAAAAGVGAALGLDRRQTGRRARHRRQHGERHHRISRRRRLDQAHACGLGGAVGPARRVARRAPASSGRAPCSKACTACSTASRTRSEGNYEALTGDFGERWVTETLAFKPYPCGTMTHPYIDCARRLAARGIEADDIEELVCEVGEGTVHRLWEPLADKQRPPNGYARQVLDALLHRGRASCAAMSASTAFTDEAVQRCRPCSRSPRKVRYVIDPDNPYPNNFTGHIRASLRDGTRGRGAAAASARRRARAAVARRTSRRNSC